MSRRFAGRALLLCAFVGCGDDGATPDAPVIIDAPIDVAIDAPSCAAPNKQCGTSCLAVAEDEQNCGDCGVECHGGQACTGTCTCPAAFIPATLDPDGFDRFQGAMGITVAISPNIGGGGINPVLFGYDAQTPRGADIDLSMGTLGTAPFVATGYHFDINTMTTDAAYVATAGTLHFTKACATEAQGTLTNATFQGVLGDLGTAAIDPLGCTFTVATLAFHVQSGAACP